MTSEPKKENVNVGFHYNATDEQIKAHQKKSTEEIFISLKETAKFIYDIQTPEERERMKKAKNFKW